MAKRFFNDPNASKAESSGTGDNRVEVIQRKTLETLINHYRVNKITGASPSAKNPEQLAQAADLQQQKISGLKETMGIGVSKASVEPNQPSMGH